MKKFYALAVVLSFLAGSASAQDFYWIGAANGDWSNTANWSNTSGGPSAGAYPDGTGHNVILDANASIRLNISVNLNSLSVTGTTTQASITGSGGGGDANPRILTVNSTSAGSPGLLIQAGCRLENSAINGTYFQFTFADNGKASINGEWLFTGDIEQDNFAYFLLPETTGQTTAVSVNSGGAISIGANTIPPANEFTGDDYLIFNSGATLNILGSFAIVPAANYQTGSVVNITGVTNEGVSIEETGSLGTINYNCPNQAASVSLT
ncbi:MAG: hypothetical protein JNK79_01465, partial [Chitinophagaceae bacterium]|nr:hypothetical protein [Chitinophagaceae bacterium]